MISLLITHVLLTLLGLVGSKVVANIFWHFDKVSGNRDF